MDLEGDFARRMRGDAGRRGRDGEQGEDGAAEEAMVHGGMIARYRAADKAVQAGCSVGRVTQNGWGERSEATENPISRRATLSRNLGHIQGSDHHP